MRGERGGRVPLPCRRAQTGEANTHPRGHTCLKLQRGVKRREKEREREREREKGGIVPAKRQEKEQINGGMIMNYFLAGEGVRGER